MAWSHAISDNEKPPINFPMNCLVGKYALPVVYYVAGWTLYSASKASTIAADKRPLFFRFAAAQTIDGCAAKSMDLLTSLVEWRKRRASVYCTREYFDFVCLVESIYLVGQLPGNEDKSRSRGCICYAAKTRRWKNRMKIH